MKDAPLPILGGRLSIEVRDAKGSLLSQSSQPMRSYVANFNRAVISQLTGVAQSLTRTTGVTGLGAVSANWLNNLGPSGSGAYGLVIGTSPRAVVGTDFKLGTPYLAGGTTANRFTYAPGTFISETKSVGTLTYRYQRTMTNNTGAALTVNEVGFIPHCTIGGTVTALMLAIRDVILPTVVPNLSTITVTYDLFAVK